MIHSVIVTNEDFPGLNPVQFGYEDCAPGHFFGPAVRPYWLLHYVVSGKGIFKREDGIYNVNPGEIFVIPPYIQTYYEADSQDPWYYIWIGFTTDMKLPKAFDLPVIKIPGASDIFGSLGKCRNFENGRSAFLSSRLWALTALTLESSETQTDYIDKALDYMSAEYMHNISVSSIASLLNLNRSYFSSLFCKRIGKSPMQYLIGLRLEKAMNLMIFHGETPSSAANSVGYTDLFRFSKAFKKKYGLSPRNYIKSYKEKNN